MFVSGIKEIVQCAFEAGKFATNGRPLPEINFSEPVLVEVTAIDSTNLVSTICCEDDTVTDFGKAFSRTLYLQLTYSCIYHDALLARLSEVPELNELLTAVKKVRVSMTGYTPYNQKPHRKPLRPDPNAGKHVQHQKLVLEKLDFLVPVA